jgi:hypothetical protein
MNGENRYAIWSAFNRVRAHVIHKICFVLDSFDKWKMNKKTQKETKPFVREPWIQTNQAVKRCKLIWNGK